MNLRTIITNTLGVIIFVGAAVGLSFVALAKPSLNWSKPEVVAPQPVTETPVVQTPVQTETPAAAPAPAEPVAKTATTNSFVRLRKGPSTSTDVLAELQAATVVTLLPDANSLWQQVQYGNLIGYVYKSYLTY